MKVFMSWSGQRSKAVAELLTDWVKCVVQVARPWISTRGIDRGALWYTEINNELADTAVGIICITAENKDAPWILFEAGALAKGLVSARVCTVLVDLFPPDLQPPLAQFNHTLPNRDGMLSLVRTLNSSAPELHRLDPKTLLDVFNTFFPQFERDFAKIIAETPEVKLAPRNTDDVMAEILEGIRGLNRTARSSQMDLMPNEGLVRMAMNQAKHSRTHATLSELVGQMHKMLNIENLPLEVVVRIMEERGYSREFVRKAAEIFVDNSTTVTVTDFVKAFDSAPE